MRRNSVWVELAVVCAALSLATAARAQCADGSPPPCTSARPASAPPASSVAVLYFASSDTADAFFAEGLSEEIATSLGRVPRITIKIPSAVRRAQRVSGGDVRAIGRALNVRWVVDGSVRRGGAQMRVSVRLVDAERETVAWSNSVTHTATDPFTLQEDIARSVATGVVGVLTPVERAAVATKSSTNTQAYERYLKGNWYIGRRGAWLRRAADEYEASLRLDPAFGAARAGIALAYLSAADYSIPHIFGTTADTLRRRALALADSVIQRDPAVALAWIARGASLRRSGRFTESRQSIARAITLEPNNAEAHYRMGQTHWNATDFPEARASLLRSIALDPARPVSWHSLGTVDYFERRYADAARMLDSALALDPDYTGAMSWKAVVLRAAGDSAGAERMANARARALRADGVVLTYGTNAVSDSGYAQMFMVGHTPTQKLAQLGRFEEALGSLDRWLNILSCRHVARDPAFDRVRSDPRFQKFERACFALPEPRQ